MPGKIEFLCPAQAHRASFDSDAHAGMPVWSQMSGNFSDVEGTSFQEKLKSNLKENLASEFADSFSPGATDCSNFVQVCMAAAALLGAPECIAYLDVILFH